MSCFHLAINAIPFSPGGGLTGALGLASAFRRLHDVKVTVFASKSATIEAVRELDVSVIPVAVGRNLPARMWWQTTRFDGELRRLDCDALISTNYAVPWISIPQIVHHQNVWCFKEPTPFEWPAGSILKHMTTQSLARRAMKRASANVFVSQYLRSVAEEMVPGGTCANHVIYNGLDDVQLESARSHGSCWERDAVICAVQVAARQKDNDTLLRAFADLVHRRPQVPWRLEIAGGGDWEPYVKMANGLLIRDRVIWHGHLPREQLDALFRRSLCLMFTSYFESFGNPPIEAMAQGCPVIAVNETAMPEVIGDAGLLVRKGDSVAFSSGALAMWDDRSLRADWVRRGHQRALRYSWQASARQFMSIARAVVARMGASGCPGIESH